MAEAGKVYLGVKLQDSDFLSEVSQLAASASKTLQQKLGSIDFSGITKEIKEIGSSLGKAIKDQTSAIDHMSDQLQQGVAESLTKGAQQGVASAGRIASNIQIPKIKVELDEAQLNEQLSIYSQKWEAIDNQRIAQARKVAEIKQQIEESGSNADLEAQLGKAQEKLANLKLEASKADSVVFQLEQTIEGLGNSAGVETVTEDVKNISAAANEASASTGGMGDNFKKATKTAVALGTAGIFAGKQISSGMKNAKNGTNLFHTATQKASGGLKKMIKIGLGMMGIRSLMLGLRRLVSSVSDSLQTMAQTNSGLANSLNGITNATTQMKGAFAVAVAPLVQSLIPVLQKVVEWLTKAFNAVALFFGALTGKKTVQIATGATGAIADNLGSAGSAATGATQAVNKLKRSLAGFDEIEILSFSDDSSGGGGSGGGGGSSGGTSGNEPIFSDVATGIDPISEGLQSLITKLQKFWQELSNTEAWKAFEIASQRAWDNVKTSASRAWGNIHSAWEETKPKLIESWNELAPRFMELWLNRASYVWLPLISGATGAFLEIGGSFVANVIKGVGSFAEMATAILSPFIDSMNQFWEEHGQEVADRIYRTFDTLKEGVTKVFDAIGEFFRTTFDGLRDWFSEHGDEIKEIWRDTWETAWGIIKPIWDEIDSIAREIFDALAKFFDDNSEKVRDLIVTTWDTIWAIIEPLWRELNKLARQVFGDLQEWWSKHGEDVKDIFRNAWHIISDYFSDTLDILISLFSAFGKLFSGDFSGFWEDIKQTFINLWERIEHAFGNSLDVLQSFFSVFGLDISQVVDGIKQTLGGITEFITGVFSGNWEQAWNGIVNIFSGIWESLKGLVAAPLNYIIDGLNWFTSQLNKIKIPDWVPGVGGMGINIPQMSHIQLARGGVVEQPTMALVGEAGKEAVMPLERNTGWITELASQLAERGGGSGQDMNVTIPIYLGTDTLIGTLEAAIDREGRLRNKPVFS